MAIGRAGASELDEINAFYRLVGYPDQASPADTLWVARDSGEMIAAVRICPQPEGYLLLRGLYVTEDLQRQGIGSQLGRAALSDAAGRVCYCIPFTHLETFYRRLSFTRIRSDHAPEKVALRSQRYLDEGLDVIVMRRLPVYDC